MSNEPSVTVIIPYKKDLRYLFSAINSVSKQTYKNYIIKIIYDNTNKLDLKKINIFIKNNSSEKFPPIKIYVNEENLGAGLSRNIAIKKSNTKYIAFLDSDDLWKSEKLKEQIFFMEKNKLLFSHTSYTIIDTNKKFLSSRIARSIITFMELTKSCDIGLSTVIINTKFLKNNKFYFPKIKTKEDFVLWLKIASKLKSLNGINKKLSYYRKTNNSLSSNKLVSLVNGYKVYRKYMKFNIIKSVYYLFILSTKSLKKNLFNNF